MLHKPEMVSLEEKNRAGREAILCALREKEPACVADLAECLNLSPIRIRGYLNALKAERLINMSLGRQEVGRPKHIYTLTDKAKRLLSDMPRSPYSCNKRD
jgi:predicted ArsR family transcriptional regulator